MADEIRDLKDLQMVEFEKRLWARFGGKCANPQDRVAVSSSGFVLNYFLNE